MEKNSSDNSIAIFFAFIAICVVVLLLLYFIAKKYLNGVFTKVQQGEEEGENLLAGYATEDEIYLEKRNLASRGLFKSSVAQNIVSPYQEYTEKSTVSYLKRAGLKETSEACVKLSVKYLEEQHILQGVVREIENFDSDVENAPNEISLHFKIMPNKRFSQKSNWKPASSKVIGLSFTMGPIEKSDLLKSYLCCRLYGRRKKLLSRPRRYGEFCVQLKCMESHNNVDLKMSLMPIAKNAVKYISEDDLSIKATNPHESEGVFTDDDVLQEENVENENLEHVSEKAQQNLSGNINSLLQAASQFHNTAQTNTLENSTGNQGANEGFN